MKSTSNKRFHFQANWKNGDPFSICSYGSSKKDAFIKILSARKKGLFKYNKGDNFHVKNITEEEVYSKLRRKGCSHNDSILLSKHGHTFYIVRNGNVEIN